MASDVSFSQQHPEGYWRAEVAANATSSAYYVLLCRMLGRDLREQQAALEKRLRLPQPPAAETYLALRLLGVAANDPDLQLMASSLRGQGGLARASLPARIALALFGLVPWAAVPAMPSPFLLTSRDRATWVALFPILHHRPVYAGAAGLVDELWLDATKQISVDTNAWQPFRAERGFTFGRKRVLARCLRWLRERQEAPGDWAGRLRPTLAAMLALHLAGDTERVQHAWQALDELHRHDGTAPVWDTALTVIRLLDAGSSASDPRLIRAVEWLAQRQLFVEHGDWKLAHPGLAAGGWSRDGRTTWYPDGATTALVVLALLRQDATRANRPALVRALNWLAGMQERDGGWESVEVTQRVLEAFGFWLQTEGGGSRPLSALRLSLEIARDRAARYLRRKTNPAKLALGRFLP